MLAWCICLREDALSHLSSLIVHFCSGIASYNHTMLSCYYVWLGCPVHPVASLCCTHCCRLTTIRLPFFSYRWRNVTSCQPPKIKVYLQGTYILLHTNMWLVSCILLHTVTIHTNIWYVTYRYILLQTICCMQPWWARGRIAFRWLLGGTWPGAI